MSSICYRCPSSWVYEHRVVNIAFIYLNYYAINVKYFLLTFSACC